MKNFFALTAAIFICLLAAPAGFSDAGKPSINTKPFISLPLTKSTKSIVCVNRNFTDTQKFGDALYNALGEYSSKRDIKLAEFVPKEAVAAYDYVWTFQVTSWKDKNHDDVPEKVKALVLVYDKDFKLLIKSTVKASQSKDPEAPNCLDFLLKEYLDSLYNDIVEVTNEKQAE